ncbi:PLDc N-terminal domain-containing protein [Saccharopolyspora sp. MS10]|uniref:PLDc N-terminal domain-containing protein n=1 Tax=Saccharopolyspora sp. MS10 TaxID=3385973 RepID=UPI0039A03F28
MTHVLEAAGLGQLWIIAIGLLAAVFLHVLMDVLVQPIDGGRKLLWAALVLVLPVAGAVLWYRLGPRTVHES